MTQPAAQLPAHPAPPSSHVECRTGVAYRRPLADMPLHAANGQRRASGSNRCRSPRPHQRRAGRQAGSARRTRRDRAVSARGGRRFARAGSGPRKTGPRSHAPVIAGAIVGIALACLLIWFVGGAALRAFMDDGTTDEVIVTDFENADAKEAPKAVDADGTLEVMGFNYTFAPADGGTNTLARQLTDSTADPVPLFTVTGTPAGMATYEGFIYVMSNGEGSSTSRATCRATAPSPATSQTRRHDRGCCARGLPAAAHRGRWGGCIRWSSRGSKGWPERRRAAADYRGTSDRIRTLMRCRGRALSNRSANNKNDLRRKR